ncbi:MAG: molybdate ABC transporter permease subunit [Coriobacteriaceae bacterium]|nr:molybdate ABC transporter permease subunit [Coriobacteriaceae bacterium]
MAAWTGLPVLFAVLAVLVPLLAGALGTAPAAWAGETARAGQRGAILAARAPQAAPAPAAPFALSGFDRSAKGTARAVSGQPAGYRFPLADDATLALVRTPTSVLVWVDAEAATAAGFDPTDPDAADALKAQIAQLDADASLGGAKLADADVPWEFTTEPELVRGPYEYRFAVAGEDGTRYLTVLSAAAAPVDPSDGALWSDSARLVPASDTPPAEAPGALDRAASFLSSIDYRPLWVSVKTGAAALFISFSLGLLAAWRTCGTSGRLKGLLDSVFTIPMVLPPTVCGFLLLMLFGRSSALGRWLVEHGVSVVFSWPAAVIAAVVVSFPLVYRTALGAFEGLDPRMLDAARTLGWSERRIFWRIMLPLGWPSIAAGAVLAFARAMGEFGCTLFFAGNYAGVTQTIPIAIYFEWMGGNTSVALFWVVVVIAFSFAVVLAINLHSARAGAYRRGQAAGRRGRLGEGRACPDGACTGEVSGGDALRIDRAALRELLGPAPEAGAGREGGA